MKNETSIWMPFFIGDYLKKTSRLSTVQHGIYLLLIFDYWVNGKLPDDDETLSRISKLDLETFKNHKTVISSFFQVEGGYWKHSRIDEEIANANENKQKRHDRAQKGAMSRWNHATSNAPSIQQAMLNECPSPSPSPSPSYINNNIAPKNRASSEVKLPFGAESSVLLTATEHEKLVKAFGEEGTKRQIANLESYILSKGVKYKSHYHTILNWERMKKEKTGNVVDQQERQRPLISASEAIQISRGDKGTMR